jgi:hypothetical protein
MMMSFKCPEEPKKPTAWLRQLDLKSRRQDELRIINREVNECLKDPTIAIEHATRYVTKNKATKQEIKKWIKPLTDNPIQLLDIIPIGGKCLCHNNAEDAKDIMNQLTPMTGLSFREARGYNLMSCPCGTSFHGEIHSVIYCNEKNSYFDVTEDMFDEEKKWFVEVPELTKNYVITKALNVCRKYDMIVNNDGCRRCGVKNQRDHYRGDLEVIKKRYS